MHFSNTLWPLDCLRQCRRRQVLNCDWLKNCCLSCDIYAIGFGRNPVDRVRRLTKWFFSAAQNSKFGFVSFWSLPSMISVDADVLESISILEEMRSGSTLVGGHFLKWLKAIFGVASEKIYRVANQKGLGYSLSNAEQSLSIDFSSSSSSEEDIVLERDIRLWDTHERSSIDRRTIANLNPSMDRILQNITQLIWFRNSSMIEAISPLAEHW